LDGRFYSKTHLDFFFGAGSRAATIAYDWKSESASDMTYSIGIAAKTNLIKDILKLVLCQSGALDVFYSTQLLRHTIAIFLADGLHLLTGELLANGRVIPKIDLGTPGQWWCTSGNHFSRTFSNEAGEVTEKQTRKTSV
jgi:hypothetical protein